MIDKPRRLTNCDMRGPLPQRSKKLEGFVAPNQKRTKVTQAFGGLENEEFKGEELCAERRPLPFGTVNSAGNGGTASVVLTGRYYGLVRLTPQGWKFDLWEPIEDQPGQIPG
jgi:hypothetical protein